MLCTVCAGNYRDFQSILGLTNEDFCNMQTVKERIFFPTRSD